MLQKNLAIVEIYLDLVMEQKVEVKKFILKGEFKFNFEEALTKSKVNHTNILD